MNKKGFFLSLAAILIVIIMGLFIFLSENIQNRRDVMEVRYVQHSHIVDYIKVFRENNLPSFISMSTKFSLKGMSERVNKSILNPNNFELEKNLTYAVISGNTDYSNKIKTNVTGYTLPFFVNKTVEIMPVKFSFEYIDFNVTSVEQVTPFIVEVNSTVKLMINVSNNATVSTEIHWSDELNYSQNISVVGFVDPVEEEVITGQWVLNTTGKECFLRLIDSSYSCPGAGLSP